MTNTSASGLAVRAEGGGRFESTNAKPALEADSSGTGPGLRIARGPIVTSPVAYTSGAIPSDVVTSSADVTLGVPSENGTQVTVVNTTAEAIHVASAAGEITLLGKHAKRFVYVNEWIPID